MRIPSPCASRRVGDPAFAHKEGMVDVVFITRELGFDNPSLTMHRELAEHICTSLPFASAFIGRLLSLYGFPLQVSRCSEGPCSQPSLSQTGILYAPIRRASMYQFTPVQWVRISCRAVWQLWEGRKP